MFLLSRTTCRSEPECEGEAGATATRGAGGCWATRCPSPGTGWPSWPSQPSCHPLARAPRVLEGPDLHRPSSNVRSLLGELASLSWRREASPHRVLGGREPSALLMAPPVTQGHCAGAGRPPSHKRRRARNTGACVLARPLPAWSPISSTREALGYRDVSVNSLSGKDSRRGTVCPRVREAGGAPFPPGAGAAGWPAATQRTPQPRSRLWLGGAQIFFGEPIMTFDTKLTMALAGCSGSCSANKWHTLSVPLPCFRATNPKTLQQEGVRSERQRPARPKRGGKPLSAPSCTTATSTRHSSPDTCPPPKPRRFQQVRAWPPPQATPGRNPADTGQRRSLSPHPVSGLTPRGGRAPQYWGGAIGSHVGTGEGRMWALPGRPHSRPREPELSSWASYTPVTNYAQARERFKEQLIC